MFRKLTPQGRLTDKPMSAQCVALVVKAAVITAGYPLELFSGDYLRAGFLAEYVRDNERFREHAGESFGSVDHSPGVGELFAIPAAITTRALKWTEGKFQKPFPTLHRAL